MTPLVPLRYQNLFKAVQVDIPGREIMTAVGPRGIVGWRWRCNRCGQEIKPNTAGAQSHTAKHLRESR